MKKYIIICFLVFIVLCSQNLFGQYLKVASKSATIREHPGTQYEILEKASKGDYLILLNNGKQSQNGWYHVACNTVNDSGWIYRTLVRRHPGNIPSPIVVVSDNATISNKDIEWVSTIPLNYYQGTENLSGDELKKALYDIIKGHVEYVYTSTDVDVWDILKETDRSANSPNQVVLLYTNRLRNAEEEYANGRGWTREHVWAKSHGGFGTSKGAGTDVHSLRPVDSSVNSTRNNKDFDNGGIEYIDGDFATGCKRDSDSWEPNDSEKGDVARMLFYMAVRYEGENGELDLELTDYVNTYPEPLHGKLSVLIQWHIDDQVDDWEHRRNDIIYYDFQHNRNPFIDHPEFVNMIWSNN